MPSATMKRMATDMTPVLEKPSMPREGETISRTNMKVRPSSMETAVGKAFVMSKERVMVRIAKAAQARQGRGSNAKMPSIARPMAMTRRKSRMPQFCLRKRRVHFAMALVKPKSLRRSENLGLYFEGGP